MIIILTKFISYVDQRNKKKLLDDLKSEDTIDLKSMYPTWKLLKNKIKESCPQMSEEELDNYAKDMAKKSSSYIVTEVERVRDELQGKINTLVKTVPMIVQQSVSSVAAVGMMGSAAISAQSLKSQAKEVCTMAISAGIELPDAVGTTIKTLKTLLKLSF